jgi:adenine deaminase
MAGNAVRAGLPHEQALRAVTLRAAHVAGVDAQIGSIEVGKTANLVVWSGDPFELSTKVEHMFIKGKPVKLQSRQDALFERYKPKAISKPASKVSPRSGFMSLGVQLKTRKVVCLSLNAAHR